MKRGKLYGVSVGPGDPELLTLRAARVLAECDCVAAPALEGAGRAALRIIAPFAEGKRRIDCSSPMTRDAEATARAYDEVADRLAAELDSGRTVAFVTLGDASVYSSWSYVCGRMVARGYEVEVVPGVTSFCAAAAELREPLCERGEQLLVVPASAGDVGGALDVAGTKVFMKSGGRLAALRESLRARGVAADASAVVNCGLEGQRVVRDLDAAGELPEGMCVTVLKGDRLQPSPVPAAEARDALIREFAARVSVPDGRAARAAVDKWNGVAKPIGSLGVLEDDVVRIAALTGSADVRLESRVAVVMCADNGVVAQGVTQCGQEVTAAVAANVSARASSVCKMARPLGVDVVAVDMGMACPPDPETAPNILRRAVARGTRDITCGPAMSRAQALEAIRAGVEVAEELAARGCDIICSGEMGIGNTTTSSAMSAVLLGMPAEALCGRGAGLTDEGLARKVAAVKRAIEVNAPDAADALDVLSKLGGFDIAGMAGLFIGGAIRRVPVVIDGYISALAAYVAARLVPACVHAMLASHVSAEPAAKFLIAELGLRPAIQAGMRLGEGTGAVCLVPLLDAALALYDGTTFAATGIAAYDPALSC